MDTTLAGRLHKIAVDAAHLEVAVLRVGADSARDRAQIEYLLKDLNGQVIDAMLVNARPQVMATEPPPVATRVPTHQCRRCQQWFHPSVRIHTCLDGKVGRLVVRD